MDVLALYDDRAVSTGFVRQHLDAIRRHSRHRVHFAAATYNAVPGFPLGLFDAIVIHFSVRLAFDWHLSSAYASRVAAFRGAKILIIQDEYDMPMVACTWIRRLGIQTVLTCVPARDREAFYPRSELPGVRFVQCLTGYLPDELPPASAIGRLADRPVEIGYRGRRLPVWYGSLAREKFEIGVRMRELAEARGVVCDIEWTEDKRLQEQEWFDFLRRCRAMLGTESGANVVDSDGSIRRRVKEAQAAQPDLSEFELYDRFVRPHDGLVRMNQISPKIFEAIALKTALVLFEGEYSGVIRPDEHYIALRKDFSNVEEVFARLRDLSALQAMVDRAFAHVCRPEVYGYGQLVEVIDGTVEQDASAAGLRKSRWTYAAVRCETGEVDWGTVPEGLPSTRPLQYRECHVVPPLLSEPLTSGITRRIWLGIPAKLRDRLVPTISRLVRKSRQLARSLRSG